MARHHYETLQQVFDDAYRGLHAQGFQHSYRSDRCAYRGDDGARCAVGHCIPDDLYSSDLEGTSPLADREAFLMLFGKREDALRVAVAQLQSAHDESDHPEDMKRLLVNFADIHGLTIPSVEEAA